MDNCEEAGPSRNSEGNDGDISYPPVCAIEHEDASIDSDDQNMCPNTSESTNENLDFSRSSEEENGCGNIQEYRNLSGNFQNEDSTEEDYTMDPVEHSSSDLLQALENECCYEDEDNRGVLENECCFEDEENQDDYDSDSSEGVHQNIDERINNNLQPLETLINSAGFSNPVTTTVDASPGGILLNAMKFSFEHNLSQVGFTDLLKLINCIFSERILPDTRYFMDKLFNSSAVKFHALCPVCDAYVGEFDRSKTNTVLCSFCEAEIFLNDPLYKDFFIILDPCDEIKELLQANDEYYNYVVTERVHENGIYKDIYDGKEYRKFVKSLEIHDKASYATCSFNSDGSPVFKSSTFSIWPIQIMLNELPHDVRTNKPIVCALWFGKSKPDMNVFLDPFVKMMNNLSDNGVACQIMNEDKIIKIFPILCCVDSVARAPMQGLVQFNGHYGCNWCLHPSEWVETAPRRGSTKYPLLDYLPSNRTKDDTLKHMQESLRIDKPVYGLKNTTPLIYLLKFCIILGFVPDYMHCILLGVGKQFTHYFLDMLSKSDIEKIDQIVTQIKFPRAVSHLTRPFSEIKQWKAKDWENWILYSSVPVLTSVLQKKYLLHWITFVEAFHLLMSSNILITDIKRAQELLADFVGKTEMYYSKSAMTYNVHQLLHIAQSVADWGPLWAHSGFAFESGNGQILKYIKCAKGVTSQISRAIAIRKNEVILKNHILLRSCRQVIDYYLYLDSKITKKTVKVSSIRYFGVPLVADEEWVENLRLSTHVSVYKKIVKDKCLFQSSQKVNKRSNNSFAQTINGKYIEILYFLSDRNSHKEYTLCKILKTTNAFNNKLPMLRKVTEIDQQIVAISTSEISKICLFMETNEAQFICAVPHMYVY